MRTAIVLAALAFAAECGINSREAEEATADKPRPAEKRAVQPAPETRVKWGYTTACGSIEEKVTSSGDGGFGGYKHNGNWLKLGDNHIPFHGTLVHILLYRATTRRSEN
jgi:hypothetical protein